MSAKGRWWLQALVAIVVLLPFVTIASLTHFLAPVLCKIPWWLKRRMVLNLAVTGAIGLMPGLGSVLLTSFRLNVRNAALLEEYLRMRRSKEEKEWSS